MAKYLYTKALTVDSLDAVPEAYKPLYVDNGDGTYAIPEALLPIATMVDGLATTIDKVRMEQVTLKGQFTSYKEALKEYGDDPTTITETIAAKIAEGAASKVTPQQEAEKIEKIKKDMIMGHEKIEKELNDKNAAMENTVKKYVVDSELTKAISENKGNLTLLPKLIQDRIKVEPDANGLYKPVVYGENGAQEYDHQGNPMSVTEFVKTLRTNKDYATLFESDSPSGAGTAQVRTAGTANAPTNAQPSLGLRGNDIGKELEALKGGRA